MSCSQRTCPQRVVDAITEETLWVMFAVAYFVLGNAEEAWDAVQSACLKLSRVPLDPLRNWVALVKQSTFHEACSLRRRRSPMVALEAEDTVCSRDKDALETLMGHEIVLHLSHLPVELRQAVSAYYLEEKTYTRIGEEMGCSTTHAWSLVKRGVKQLRATFGIE